MGSLGGARKKGTVWTYKAWIVLLPLCLLVMSAPMNVAENTPIADLIPLDEEAGDVEALAKQLEAVRAKNDKIAQRKKERKEVKCQKEAEEEKNWQEAEAVMVHPLDSPCPSEALPLPPTA